jgi:iron complex outermembrane receptor protein
MKSLIILAAFFFIPLLLAQGISIKGKILDAETNKPLAGTNIFLQSNHKIGTSSDASGEFSLNDIPKSSTIIFSYLGYEVKTVKVENDTSLVIGLEPKLIPSQTVFVEGSIGKVGTTPLTFSKIKRRQIEEDYVVQDVPEFLSTIPSVTYYSEGGSGIGYNYLSIRGFDQRRISVSINGIPQNDPEDHDVYWLDFPDLLASTDAIQVQRGAGSGVIGYPAIGGSINIITSTFSNEPKFNLEASYGSYNTKKYSISYSSGLIKNKYSFYAKFSKIQSSGYRNNSWTDFNSYYLSAVRYDDNLTTQIDLYGGPIADGLAYTGLPKFAVKQEKYRRLNYSDWGANNVSFTYTTTRRPSEIENFSQPHYELLNELFLVFGQGFFDYDGSWGDTTYFRLTHQYGFNPTENPSDVLIKAEEDESQFGWIPRLSWKHKNGELIVGAEFRSHKSLHWGNINFGQNLPLGLTKSYDFYSYNGAKDAINGYVHEDYDLNAQINLLGEVQLAYHKYRLYNEKFVRNDFSVSNLFFNPRFGINYKFNPNLNSYLSYARVSTEPRLSDYYNADESSDGAKPQFQKNADGSFNFDKPLVVPETMNDFEYGISYNSETFSTTLNLYYMLFDKEIVANGEVDQYGQPIVGNIDRTLHKGVEFSVNAKPTNQINIYGNTTLSDNTIQNGKYYIDRNDYIDLSGNQIGGFPQFMANFGFSINYDNFFLKFNGKYLGSFYSDNFADKLKSYLKQFPDFVTYSDNKNEAYLTADVFISYELTIPGSLNSTKIFFRVNNLFNRLYSAYAIGEEFFPAAERNYLAGIQLGL